MKSISYDICIIGGGAAGLAAAITAGRQWRSCHASNNELKLCIIEKNHKPAQKILATGNGRCNITNTACDDYNITQAFFESIGVVFRIEDEGRVYPYCGQAAAVAEALVNAVVTVGTDIICDAAAIAISRTKSGNFGVEYDCIQGHAMIEAPIVMIATGGKAGPMYGCTGDGYKMVRNLGHKTSRLAPALAPVECNFQGNMPGKLRVRGKVSLLDCGRIVASETGEIQFTEKGVSGICVFNLSRMIRLKPGYSLEDGFNDYQISVDFAPEMSVEQLQILIDEHKALGLDEAGQMLLSVVPKVLTECVINVAGSEDSKIIASVIKDYRLSVKGVEGWKKAQCTAGGVSVDEINNETMESLVMPGLFLGGEILDYDGPCGGYNLQNAWMTGIKCGRAMAQCIELIKSN